MKNTKWLIIVITYNQKRDAEIFEARETPQETNKVMKRKLAESEYHDTTSSNLIIWRVGYQQNQKCSINHN